MHRRFLSSLVALLAAFQLVSAVQNKFINPPPGAQIHEYADNNVYTQGSTINFLWSTNYKTLSLVLWQNDNATSQYLLTAVPALTTFSWEVDLYGLYSLKDGNVFFMVIYDEGGSNENFSSHYFNITGPTPNHAAASTSSSSTSASTSPTGAVATSSTTPRNAASSDGAGLSEGAKIGIGVGVGVGVVCLIIGVVIGFCVSRRRRNAPSAGAEKDHGSIPPSYSQGSNQPFGNGQVHGNNGTGYYAPPTYKHAPDGYQDPPQSQQSQWPPQELGGDVPIHEMSSNRPAAELSEQKYT